MTRRGIAAGLFLVGSAWPSIASAQSPGAAAVVAFFAGIAAVVGVVALLFHAGMALPSFLGFWWLARRDAAPRSRPVLVIAILWSLLTGPGSFIALAAVALGGRKNRSLALRVLGAAVLNGLILGGIGRLLIGSPAGDEMVVWFVVGVAFVIGALILMINTLLWSWWLHGKGGAAQRCAPQQGVASAGHG